MEARFKDSLQRLTESERLWEALVGSTTLFQSQMDSLLRSTIVKIKLPDLDFGPFLETIDELKAKTEFFFDQLNSVIAQASGIMTKNGWWIVGFMPITFYGDLVSFTSVRFICCLPTVKPALNVVSGDSGVSTI